MEAWRLATSVVLGFGHVYGHLGGEHMSKVSGTTCANYMGA
jgi:hypothetical protein